MTASIILLEARAPSPLASDMARAGYKVHEALTVSEALFLCEHESFDAIVIAPDVEDPDVTEAQLRYITIKLKPQTTAKDLIWELSKLFPGGSTTVQ